MPSNVRVAVRIRPLLDHEKGKGHKQNLMEVNKENNQISLFQPDNSTRKNYQFDKIIDDHCCQQEVFE